MMKQGCIRVRLCAALLSLFFLGASFPLIGTSCAAPMLYTATYLDAFDTVLTLQVVSASREKAEQVMTDIHGLIQDLHRQFDIYHDWFGIHNLKTVNEGAGNGTPVAVSQDIIDLLTLGRAVYELSNGKVNINLGAVLSLWHAARENGGYVPDMDVLTAAADHIDPDSLVIDRDKGTVYLTDPEASLDVGAIAKGYAAARVAELAEAWLEKGDISGLLFNLGGHVLALGHNRDGESWQVGVRDVQNEALSLCTLPCDDASVVTSSVDQRSFSVNGVRYHHLIDPDTLYPGDRYLSVTVCVPAHEDIALADGIYDSTALADALSTALFLLSREEGMEVLSVFPGAYAIWVMPDGRVEKGGADGEG